MEGWIKLHRKIIDSKIFATEKGLKIWIWMLCKANHKERHISIRIGNGQSPVQIKRGQLLFGRMSAVDELNISSSSIYKWIKKFETDKMIAIESNNHYSIITICKYEEYNESFTREVTAKEQLNNNQLPTKETPSNTLKKKKKLCNSNNEKKQYRDELIKDTTNHRLANSCDYKSETTLNVDYLSIKNTIHKQFKSAEFEIVWNKLCCLPKWRNKPESSLIMTLEKLRNYKEDFAIELIKRAIIGNYQGLFFKNTDNEYANWVQQKEKNPQILLPTDEKKHKLLKKLNNES